MPDRPWFIPPILDPQDALLFEAIISDLFPATQPPVEQSVELRGALSAALASRGLQAPEGLLSKAVQLRETLGVRFGVMLVGQAGEDRAGSDWLAKGAGCGLTRGVGKFGIEGWCHVGGAGRRSWGPGVAGNGGRLARGGGAGAASACWGWKG